ncbi:hypothetical protein DMA12_24945 [Amycolatopsis balhimycina DSM 5908]|uniref:DUF6292 domain-containing protein n=1 Tax=Amycolatopsis balhimycina DSM 5908 TaxID=1081091 RepID=A0A428WDV0_AMYBA|nr:DUF6292 family protein [Amycolatopsis balhimycina]RSM41250.1 hypothetical protein DMA12_24945 [Amycolatopsis balhimycina DSM 5908]
MNTLIGFGRDIEYHFARGLRAYLARVARAVGVGFESCSLDLEVPASGYIALDRTLPDLPGHDLALIWDEVHGWSAVVEPAGESAAKVFAYLGGRHILPPPRTVARFLEVLRVAGPPAGSFRPPVFRRAGHHEDLVDSLPVTGPEGLLRRSSAAW